MKKYVPPFKSSSDPKVGTGSSDEFSDAKIKMPKTVESSGGMRKGFTRKAYTTACGKPSFGKGLC